MEKETWLWTPPAELVENCNLNHYMRWLREKGTMDTDDYHQLWTWSVENIPAFWKSIREYFDVLHEGEPEEIMTGTMPRVNWFPGLRLNYAEHIFRKENDTHPAIVFKSENTPLQTLSWKALRQQVSALQKHLESLGIREGDRIVGYLPCIPEATVSLLATTALGAVWSGCSPDFGTPAVVDRFEQIKPRVLIATDRYRYNGKTFDKTDVVRELVNAIPSLEHVILLSETGGIATGKPSSLWSAVMQSESGEIKFNRVPFDHPIWVLYSSGTTGLPKAIVHGHGGILLEQLKYGTFHNDFREGERCFWYTTTGWMMWNYIHGSLLAGGTMVLYDGSPAYPDLNALWQFCEDAGIHHFGTSAGFILANLKAGVTPAASFDLTALRSISSTGSTLPPEGFQWVYQNVKHNLWLASMSGGTDVCSAFVGGNPQWPVYAGEIQCRALGCKLEAFDEEGRSVQDEVGEMVITGPMPSMPTGFWNDPDFRRYEESYFEMFPGVWRHGDWTKITPRHGVVIYGRSDATLNRGGVRIGTSEIYRAVDKVAEVKDSLVICIEKSGGDFWMPLFVVLNEDYSLTDALRKTINDTIRREYSPRHVPDEIIAVPDIPYTISGKKTETPVKKVLMGKDPKQVVNADALRNPASMDFFIRLSGG